MVAGIGGLLSLFMGFSVLSIIEALYFCTLRLSCNLQRRRRIKKRRAAQEKLLSAASVVEPQEDTDVEQVYPENRF